MDLLCRRNCIIHVSFLGRSINGYEINLLKSNFETIYDSCKALEHSYEIIQNTEGIVVIFPSFILIGLPSLAFVSPIVSSVHKGLITNISWVMLSSVTLQVVLH